jgi:hypothetical protein
MLGMLEGILVVGTTSRQCWTNVPEIALGSELGAHYETETDGDV